jgi:hypothetical protein
MWNMAVMDARDRQCRAADHRPGSARQPGLLNLDRQWLSARDNDLAAPARVVEEILGYRRVYRVGLLLFTLASLFCALSHTLVLLTIARVVQARPGLRRPAKNTRRGH